MQPSTIAFTYSKRNKIIANKFIQTFNQFNLNLLTLEDLEKKSSIREEQLSVLYHLDTFIILLSEKEENDILFFWEFFYSKYIQERNIVLVPILLEESINVDIPNNIKTVHFTNDYLECVKETNLILTQQKLVSQEMKLDLSLLYPMLVSDVQMFGAK